MVNVRKRGCFSAQERTEHLRKALAGDPKVRVDRWEGLLSEYMRVNGERTVVRGVRSAAEFDVELSAAQANRALNPDMETLLLPAGEGKQWISSSAVREIAAFGGDIREFLPPECAEEIRQGLSNK